jgi:hypothetical protein
MWEEIFAGLERLKLNRKFWGKLDADDSLFDTESDELLEEGYSLKKERKMLFKLLDFVAEDKGQYGDKGQFVVQMFGISEQGKTVSASVSGYRPFFSVQCGQDWGDTIAGLFVAHIREMMSLASRAIAGQLQDHKKLSGYHMVQVLPKTLIRSQQ